MIFESMKERFGVKWYLSVPSFQWVIWRRHIKQQLFDNDIIAVEAIAVIGEVDKRHWPHGTGFFARVRDLCLVQRKEKQRIFQPDHSLESLADIL